MEFFMAVRSSIISDRSVSWPARKPQTSMQKYAMKTPLRGVASDGGSFLLRWWT